MSSYKVYAEMKRLEKAREEAKKSHELKKRVEMTKSELNEIMGEMERACLDRNVMKEELRILEERAIMKRKLLRTHLHSLASYEKTATMRATTEATVESIKTMKEATREASRAAASAKPQDVRRLAADYQRSVVGLQVSQDYAEVASETMFGNGERVEDERELEGIRNEIQERIAMRRTEGMRSVPMGSTDNVTTLKTAP